MFKLNKSIDFEFSFTVNKIGAIFFYIKASMLLLIFFKEPMHIKYTINNWFGYKFLYLNCVLIFNSLPVTLLV